MRVTFRNVTKLGPTGQSADHGEGGEGSGQALAAHDGGGVGGREDPRQPKQTPLENRPERCRDKVIVNESEDPQPERLR